MDGYIVDVLVTVANTARRIAEAAERVAEATEKGAVALEAINDREYQKSL